MFATVTVIGATVLTYYACEAVYRWQMFRQLRTLSSSQPDVVTELPMDLFDEQAGFAYLPNTRTRLRKYADDGRLLLEEIELRINNMGHFSHQDDSLEKPHDEFRIAVLGDSMTAAREMHQPWPDTLEDLLNQDRDLIQRLGVTRLNVINFAQDGIGIVQCGLIHEHKVRSYDADLVILNFIDEDIPRKTVYRTTLRRNLPDVSYWLTVHTYTLPCSPDNPNRFFGTVSVPFSDFDDVEKRVEIFEDIASIRRGQIRWTSPFPELFAKSAGHQVGLPPRVFSSQAFSQYYDDEEAIQSCADVCRRIETTSRRSLFLCMPGGLGAGEHVRRGELPKSTRRLGQVTGLEITPMSRYLPGDANNPAWYVPGDGHLNDLGGDIYARAMKQRVEEFLTEG